MIVTIVGQTKTPVEVLAYVDWALAQGSRHWLWLRTQRLKTLLSKGSANERAAALADFIDRIDAHLLRKPDDIAVRMHKIKYVSRLGAESDRASLTADLDKLEAALSNERRLTAPWRARISAALSRAGRDTATRGHGALPLQKKSVDAPNPAL
jgi:hypothetical protein